MSFANLDLEAQKSVVRPSKSTASTQQLNTISSQLSDLISNITKFDKLQQQLGTKRDTLGLRNNLASLAKKCDSLHLQVEKSITELENNPDSLDNPTLQYNKQKLKSQCTDMFRNYQLILRAYNERLQSVVVNEEYDSNQQNSAPIETTPLLAQQQEPQISKAELDFHESVIQQREHAIDNISRGVQDINKIFEDLNEIVNQQGEQIDTIEDNLLAYTSDNQQAHRELVKADAYQKKKRKWTCILLVVLVVVLLIVIALMS
ncbi:hypothetical protein OGAPHI_002521 [Ogataea philodendri]|uniref:t-SNARE coiled-coil homology domain-containing protein n=1 Tax=Ogataea philodendri TaxID=1378263 RepID=A0A9P8T894_9ASCO|nr:uncharacterized protein OGAPHI_002521 [Ogataea philodendri]KAH3668766.1 hypothetical protein OGAPHI_002521 [Ogataea philodendri]